MSNVKNYDVGQIKFDMFPEGYDHDGPYVSYTHELPLLSFSDVQHSVNLSLVFNYDRYREEKENNTNPFFIAPGYKLNLQKRLIYDVQGALTTFQGENGKNIELNNASDNVFTFNDESQRILRRTSSALTVEYSDFSKEQYNETGRITQAYDKYSDCPVLTYSYNVYNQLVSIVFRNSKVIYLAYESNRLKSIRYNDKVTTFYYNDDGTLDYIKHYTDIKYKFALSNVNCGSYEIELPYKVTAFEGDTATLGSKELNLVNLGKTVEIIDKIGDNPVNIISYKHSRSLIDYLPPFEYVDIVDNNGVETRVQLQDGKPFCSYEIKDGNPQFSGEERDDIFYGNVTLYNSANSSCDDKTAGVQNINDGTRMTFLDGDKEWRGANFNGEIKKGWYTVSGWIKSNSDNCSSVDIYVEPGAVNISPVCTVDLTPLNQWKYFAAPKYLETNTVFVRTAVNENISTRDFRFTYNGAAPEIDNKTDTEVEENISHINISEYVLFNGNEEIPFRDTPFYYHLNNGNHKIYDTEVDEGVTFADALRFKLRKKRDGVCDEVYYNNGKNIVTGTTDLKILHDGNFISIGNLDLGVREYSNNKKSVTRIYMYDNSPSAYILKTHTVNGTVISTEKLNNNLDVTESTVDGITTNYVFNADGLIIRESVPLLYIKDISYDNTVITVKDIDPTTEAELANTKYYLDSVWGTLERIVPSDNSIIRYYYDHNSHALTQMSFGVNPSRKNILGYSNNRLASLESGSLNYTFTYTSDKGELESVSKNNAGVEHHTHSRNNGKPTIESKYPSSTGTLHTETKVFDKYGRLERVEGILENSYHLNPRWTYLDENDNPHYTMEDYDRTKHDELIHGKISSDGKDALLSQTTDKLTGEVTKYGYYDGNLTAAVTYNAAGSVLKQETFVYDDAGRLTSDRFDYNLTTGDKVRSDINYVRSADNLLVDNRINTYSYKINGIEKAKTQNTYDNYKRIKSKAYTVGGKIFTQSIGYDGKIIDITWDSMGDSTRYQYDTMNRITSINNGNPITYEYDTYGQLIRENNKILDKTFVYEYNDIGNIISVKTYNYTTEALGTVIAQRGFGYDTTHPDRLITCGNMSISYNAMGYPSVYNGFAASWTRGKLTKLSKGNKILGTEVHSCSYNAFGQRTGTTYKYTQGTGIGSEMQVGMLLSSNKSFLYDNRGRLISESSTAVYHLDGSENIKIKYLYDENSIIGMLYTSGSTTATYYFQRNLLGDVIGIYNTSGTKVGGYAYDAWGNYTITSDTTNYDVATANPIRYRGYYYDDNTNLYYLNARYYSPELRRFISPDDTAYLDPEMPNGLNLYCYCNNDPVNYADPSGHLSIAAILIGIAIGVTIGFAGTAIADYTDDGQVFNNSVSWENYAANMFVAGLIGGLTGGIGSSTFTINLPTLTLATTSLGTTTLVSGTSTIAVSGTSVLAGAGVLGSVLSFARIGKSGGYRIDHHYPNDHDPTHVHISGDDGKTRVDIYGNPIQGDRPMTPGERKAFWKLIDKIINALKPWI